jgi:dedicated sortase system histidine kinase
MNLRRQLLLVSLLTLILPWSGCQFIRETESALREGQQEMLGGTAQAIADSLSQFPADFLSAGTDGIYRDSQVYVHPLEVEPLVDGYRDDWTLDPSSARALRGVNGDIQYVFGAFRQSVFVLVDVRDSAVVYNDPAITTGLSFADRVELHSVDAGGHRTEFVFSTEAPGALIGRRRVNGELVDDSRISAHWQNTATGYRLEARLPRQMLGEYVGLVISNTDAPVSPGVQSATFEGASPGRMVMRSPVLGSVIRTYAQDDLRLIVTDRAGWRLASEGHIGGERRAINRTGTGWLRRAYNALLEPGAEGAFADLNPLGREREPYVVNALGGSSQGAWFRSEETGRAVVAVAQPVWSGSVQTGVVILQQGTDAILSLTNSALGRLLNFTLIATLGVALALLGYASWLSLRIRRLSEAAENALDKDSIPLSLPSALADDEIGDLSRSFSSVLRQLGNYNDYLRTLASKLSHELRTPLTIVSSSLENLEHENLGENAANYTSRARDGALRLKKILDAMSEANRVEELMRNADPEQLDLRAALAAARAAYADAWPGRKFRFDAEPDPAFLYASPELIMQMLDKLIDNAVGFSTEGDEIVIGLSRNDDVYRLSVFNPGPQLPEKMRSQLFDSMVSVRSGDGGKHLGLGLHIARIIAQGHGGNISADNRNDGVMFVVELPVEIEEASD